MNVSSSPHTELRSYLEKAVDGGDVSATVKDVILGLADASRDIVHLIAQNGIGQTVLGEITGAENADGDDQKALDVMSDHLIEQALQSTGIYAYLSEECDEPVLMDSSSEIICACDPLDGSSNIDTNLTIGTIFSIFPRSDDDLIRAGRDQLAAGFFAYGPQTALIMTYGRGVYGFCLDESGQYRLMEWDILIPSQTSEFAINAANQRHWSGKTKTYVAHLLAGKDGPRTKNFNMRWAGSLVADSWRILRRGGIFLYPEDSRTGYENGRLRLVYEANPVSFLIEQAGGQATDGQQSILDIQPEHLHQRVSLIFGSSQEVQQYKGS